eukprot:CAMPEP_0195305114 /NCGR_PEP_ID=MMETSP0707-20130614/35693_1 /TAXON_ID=33640 /ORGANISM="Asterionellopsis glacialis, Strain CCMP134" /LENGTH=336 /DNA_ID=CAMNT_0040369139 /DNA_START=374 /DNA_END=1384 /DNA_ORIENTATION=-
MGMALCGILSNTNDIKQLKRSLQQRDFVKKLLLTAAIDLISGMLLTGGILMTGGGVFVVLYNSCPAWTAILSRVFLKRKMSLLQTFGVSLVCMGLIVNVAGSHRQLADSNSDGKDSISSSESTSNVTTVLVGSVVVLVGCILHSAFFVMSEISLLGNRTTSTSRRTSTTNSSSTNTEPEVSAPLWSCCLGSIESICMAFWVFTGIQRGGFQAREGDGDPSIGPATTMCSSTDFIKGFSILLLVDAVHAGAFFLLLKEIGAVGSALLKGMQTVAVVTLSAVFFCHAETTQCMTVIKACSIVLVLSGTTSYALGSHKNKAQSTKKKDKILSDMESLLS